MSNGLNIYNNLITEIDKIGNICQFQNGLCYRQRLRSKKHEPYACCGSPIVGEYSDSLSCEYITKSGCTITCLHCKVWFCHEVEKIIPIKIYKKIEYIRDVAYKHDLIDFRQSKNYTINRLLEVEVNA